MSRRNSFNIPMSFKVSEYLLEQIDELCDREHLSYSGAIRAGLTLLINKSHQRITRNTEFSGVSVQEGWS